MSKYNKSFGFFLIVLSALYGVSSLRSSGASIKMGSEPEARIGILQKTQSATLSFSGRFTVVRVSDNKELYSGADDSIKVETYSVKFRQIRSMFRVTLGKFRSYEQADYVAGTLKDLNVKMDIAQPGQWSLWFGPFKTQKEARSVERMLQNRGYMNTLIEPESRNIDVASFYDPKGKLIHIGNKPILLKPATGLFELNGKTYRGSAEVALDAYGTFSVINRVKLEDYLYSVLPGEMPSLSHPDALKAQAVIARTYFLKNMGRHDIDGFHLCGSTDCQVYNGVGSENASTTQAVKSTRGMILKSGDETVNALFHSTCGGRTAAYSDSWSGRAPKYLASVNDGSPSFQPLNNEKDVIQFLSGTSGNCDTSKYFRWEKTYTFAEMQDVFSKTVPEFSNNPDLKFGRLIDVKVTDYMPSGRAQRLEITADTGKYVFEKDAIRWVMGSIKSALFYIEKSGSGSDAKFILHGAGWGHGVGLCQVGTMNLAKKGVGFKEMLDRYYPGTRIETAWE